jgi:anti-sigma B factor antagonist
MQIEKIRDITIVTPTARQIDVMNSDDFGARLAAALTGSRKFALDLRNVLFVDSSALGKIVSALRAANERGDALVICGMGEAVALLFKMVRLSQIATLAADRDEAVATLEAMP